MEYFRPIFQQSSLFPWQSLCTTLRVALVISWFGKRIRAAVKVLINVLFSSCDEKIPGGSF